MDPNETAGPGLPGSLRQLARTLLAIIENRLELLLLELHEERIRFFKALLLAAAIAAVGALSVAIAIFALALVVLQQFGLKGLWVMSGLGLLVTLLGCWRLRARLKAWPLLSGTLAQLKKDRQCIESRR